MTVSGSPLTNSRIRIRQILRETRKHLAAHRVKATAKLYNKGKP